MILHTLCNTCLQAYQLLLEVTDIPLVKQLSDESGHTCPCPRLCGGTISLVPDVTIESMSKDPRLKHPIHLSGKQLFQAVKGLGLPDEIPQSRTVFDLALAGRVKKFELDEIEGKFYLQSLEFDNGVTFHLGSGRYGAQVLKLTTERKPNGTGNHR